ncbi:MULTISPECIES: MarR family winged helix-turn-helix transcriptional regulator [Sporomusa]|uniref:HTH-type transcriptional regulator MhqR n=2 Tax=Sporomusa TaxID=2375 RepID=A0ABP2CAU9_9FIRM|nr:MULTISPECIES: MarR family winged helix-turn-helix transcriptional regulator [Sporomusa]OLS54452.1 HTH-type transcriptional regulator MhqR [Sporomusa sphaeroides DSM 2875]CVK21077.1 HTH-type transcriptional regulator MhqR [Sporomusa sphaeroides DSM 2875]SCM83297.1 Regulatory protein MarR [uncultured Sporomusa sp.]HML32968.1 MarR family winged helix-turn-helix transcriptional regulator [Sporomusa sphaeroides]
MNSVDELTHELFTFFDGFSSWENSVIKTSDLTVSEAHAIEVLGRYGQMNMKSLAQHLGVTTGTTTVTVDRLEKKEYARRQSVKEDRRVHLITLTPKGQQAFAEHHQYHADLTEQILSVLSNEEHEQLLSILKKINKEAF